MGAAGSTARYDPTGSNSIARTDRDVGAAGGSLEVSADGAYSWRYSSSDPPIEGRWRAATLKKMGTQAGAGIVLLQGYDGADWIVTRFPAFGRPEDHISLKNWRALEAHEPIDSAATYVPFTLN